MLNGDPKQIAMYRSYWSRNLILLDLLKIFIFTLSFLLFVFIDKSNTWQLSTINSFFFPLNKHKHLYISGLWECFGKERNCTWGKNTTFVCLRLLYGVFCMVLWYLTDMAQHRWLWISWLFSQSLLWPSLSTSRQLCTETDMDTRDPHALP